MSARRYLEQLVTQQEADVRQRYGTAGRPERRFTLRGRAVPAERADGTQRPKQPLAPQC